LPVPLPCLRASLTTRARAATNSAAKTQVCLGDRKTRLTLPRTPRAERFSRKKESRQAAPFLLWAAWRLPFTGGRRGRRVSRFVEKLILLFTSLLAIPLARQSRLYAFLLAGLQVVGVTLDFLDDVLLLYLPLEAAQRIFERLAFLNANLRQKVPPPNLPKGLLQGYCKYPDIGNDSRSVPKWAWHRFVAVFRQNPANSPFGAARGFSFTLSVEGSARPQRRLQQDDPRLPGPAAPNSS